MILIVDRNDDAMTVLEQSDTMKCFGSEDRISDVLRMLLSYMLNFSRYVFSVHARFQCLEQCTHMIELLLVLVLHTEAHSQQN